MRFLHCADLHIGATKVFLKDYLQRQESMLNAIGRVADEERVDAIVIAGDVFDSADTTPEERDLLLRKLFSWDAKRTVLMIPGNHDLVDAHTTTLHYLAVLSQSGKFRRSHVVERTTLVTVRDTLFALLVCDGRDFRKHLKSTLEQIESASLRLTEDKIVVVAHQTVQGSLAAHGYRLPKGVKVKPKSSVGYYALGDIHIRQAVCPAAWYPGSPIQTAFDEDPDKGVLIVDTENPKHPKYVPIKSRKFVAVKASDHKRVRAVSKTDAYVKLVTDDPTQSIKASALLGESVVKTTHAKVDVDTSALNASGSLRTDVRSALRKRGLDKSEVKLALGVYDTLQAENK